MADAEHLAILKKGVKAWNEWRRQHHDVEPDLSGAGLRKVNLSDANLSEALLFRVDLSGANLRGADVQYAHLRGRASTRRTSCVRTSDLLILNSHSFPNPI